MHLQILSLAQAALVCCPLLVVQQRITAAAVVVALTVVTARAALVVTAAAELVETILQIQPQELQTLVAVVAARVAQILDPKSEALELSSFPIQAQQSELAEPLLHPAETRFTPLRLAGA